MSRIAGTQYLSGLWPPFSTAVEYLLAYCQYYSLDCEIVSGYRSLEEQAALYSEGRTPAEVAAHVHKHGTGGTVTDAWPGSSAHNYGLAVDVESPQLDSVRQVAQQIGFGLISWDPGHIEWPGWQQLLSRGG